MTAPSFVPHPLLRGGHRQTVLGWWVRKSVRWTPKSEDVVVDAGDGVQILLRCSYQARADAPTLLVIHGLNGSDASSYGLATGLFAWSRGWSVVRMNMRGAGDAEALCARLYNAGVDRDLLAVLELLAARGPQLAVVGFSLGANLALLTAGRQRAHLPEAVRCVVGISPPLDLAACADALRLPLNRLYERRFVGDLREGYRRRQALLPDVYAPGLELGIRTVRDYDVRITAPYGGFPDADAYYAQSSGGPWLMQIDRPALVLAAMDDPMIPIASVVRWPLPASGIVRREIMPTGGHVGFVGKTTAPGSFWAGERAVLFAEEALARVP